MKEKLNILMSNSNLKEILMKSGVFFSFKIGGLLLGYVFAYYVSKHFGTNVYGLVTLGFTLFMILSVLGKFGFDIGLTKMVSSKEYKLKDIRGLFFKIEFISLGFTLICAVLIMTNAEWIAIQWFNKPEFAPYLKWVGLTVPVWSLILIHLGLFRGLKKNLLYSVFNPFGRFFMTLIFLLLLIGYSKTEVLPIFSHFLGVLFLGVVSLIIAVKLLGKKISFKTSLSVKTFCIESYPILASSLIFILLSWVDRLIIGISRTEQELAIYDVAAKLALLVSFNLDAFNSILAPKISEFFSSKNKKQLRQTIEFSVLVSSIISLATFVVVIILADPLLNIFGEEYGDGFWVLAILAFGQLLNCLCGSVGTILQMTGHQTTYRNILGLGLVFNLALSIALVGKYGIIGVSIGTMVSTILWNVLGVYYVKRKLDVISFFNPLKHL